MGHKSISVGETPDFGGYVTRYGVKCGDGRTISRGAFSQNDGKVVPCIWNHARKSPDNVLGQVYLSNREDGVYGEVYLNSGKYHDQIKELIQHGDIKDFSILATDLVPQHQPIVNKGDIKEVSLVIAGANPQAFIDNVIMHTDLEDDEDVLCAGSGLANIEAFDSTIETVDDSQNGATIEHGDTEPAKKPATKDGDKKDDKTVGDILETMNEEQLNVLYFLVGQAREEKGDDKMKHNIFDNVNDNNDDVLEHTDIDFEEIISDAEHTYGSLRKSFLEHGIKQIDKLVDESYHNVSNTPNVIMKDSAWVDAVLGDATTVPFGRLKTTAVDITKDEARALGYIKGDKKEEEQIEALQRTVEPQTIYKLQTIDRDDVLDITDLDIIAFLKSEMQVKLNEEKARAILIGDGRKTENHQHIKPTNIKPIWQDDSTFVINKSIDVAKEMKPEDKCRAIIKAAVKARSDYRGSGSPTAFMSADLLTDLLLLTDATGRDLYEDETKLAKKLGVAKIVTVPYLSAQKRTAEQKDYTLEMIIVNMHDYKIGIPNAGKQSLFSDFDIDYNKMKYLLETRMSGMLWIPYSAITIETATATSNVKG